MLDAQPLSASLGAAIDGIQLTGCSNNEQVASILAALDEYGVLQFRGQSLSAAALRDFTAEIGPLFRHHADEGVLFADGIPEVLEMRKEPDGVRLFGGSDWHADVTFQPIRGYVSVLHALIIPPCGGDTAFASTARAFEALSPAMRDMLRGLRAVHNYYGPTGESVEGLNASHPVVYANPRTGRESIYLNRMFVTHFEGMTCEESRPLVDFLAKHITRPEFTCRVQWEEGQVVMWDNFSTLHYPINDFTGQRRLLIRCTALEGQLAE